MTTSTRPVRMCDACGGVDDHPRHVVGLDFVDDTNVTPPSIAATALRNADEADYEAIVAQIQDVDTVQKHMDCCRTDGCPDGSCDVVTSGAEDKRGDALVKHLTTRTARTEKKG